MQLQSMLKPIQSEQAENTKFKRKLLEFTAILNRKGNCIVSYPKIAHQYPEWSRFWNEVPRTANYNSGLFYNKSWKYIVLISIQSILIQVSVPISILPEMQTGNTPQTNARCSPSPNWCHRTLLGQLSGNFLFLVIKRDCFLWIKIEKANFAVFCSVALLFISNQSNDFQRPSKAKTNSKMPKNNAPRFAIDKHRGRPSNASSQVVDVSQTNLQDALNRSDMARSNNTRKKYDVYIRGYAAFCQSWIAEKERQFCSNVCLRHSGNCTQIFAKKFGKQISGVLMG